MVEKGRFLLEQFIVAETGASYGFGFWVLGLTPCGMEFEEGNRMQEFFVATYGPTKTGTEQSAMMFLIYFSFSHFVPKTFEILFCCV